MLRISQNEERRIIAIMCKFTACLSVYTPRIQHNERHNYTKFCYRQKKGPIKALRQCWQSLTDEEPAKHLNRQTDK